MSDPIMLTIHIIFLLFGIFSLALGRLLHTEPIPRFVPGHRGWSSWILAAPYGGFGVMGMGIIGFIPHLPPLPLPILQAFALAVIASFLTFFLGFFIWFPRFLLPRWYPRAVKAGVPRHDPFLMGAFKALPRTEQLELLHHTAGTTAAPVPPPVSPPAPHPVSRSGSAARFQTPRPVVVGQDAPATGISRSLPGIGHENTTDHGAPEEGSR